MLRATAVRLARPNVKGRMPKEGGTGKGKFAPGRTGLEIGKSEVEKKMIEWLRPMPRPPPRTEEEKVRLRALMIEYGKFRRGVFLARTKKQNELMRAKAAAFDALPNYRRFEAITSPYEALPLNRPLMTITPPIPGFNASDLTKN